MISDGPIIRKTRKLAHEIVDKDPGLKNHPLIKKSVLAEYNEKIEILN